MSNFVFAFGLLLCLVSAYAIPGGWGDRPVDDKFVVQAAKEATKVLSERFNANYHTKLANVLHARDRVVAGMYYDLKVVVGLTNCKKSEVNSEDIENCEFQEGNDTYDKCDVLIFRDLQGRYEVESFLCKPTSKDDL